MGDATNGIDRPAPARPIGPDVLQLVVDAAPTASVVVDVHGTLLAANAHAATLFGYGLAELRAIPVDALLPARFRERHPSLRASFYHSPSARPMGAGRDLYGLRRDGTEVPIEIGLTPIEVAEGTFVLAAIVDLTERQRAQEHQRLIIEAANAMVMVDSAGAIALVNSEAEALFGYARDELLGRSIETLVPERFRGGHPGVRAAFAGDATRRPMGAERDLFGLRKDGSEVPIEIGLNPLTTPEGQFVIASIIDITERRRAERLRILNAGMQQHNEQLAALNQELESFSYSVSHDLRAPIRAISGFAGALEEDCGALLDDEGRRLLAVIRGEAARMGRLIDDLLEFSRLGREPLRVDVVDMTALARDVAERLKDDYRATVSIEELPPAWGDVRLLRQVWENLIANAFKYSATRAAPCVRIAGVLSDGESIYCVEDNGVGFDMTYADKLFGVFQRLHHDDEFSGTGVGLATVSRIVVRHEGRVWGVGEVDKGAQFSFALPVQPA
ncbi:MAG TPA: PAS domain S-box protein [Candidatus Sulfotelmatobacter sp.]|nr:PAS domain S-box protein [Candidatus Sulfotelmatobacter sp.]